FGYPGFETFRAPNFYLRFTGPWDLDRVECPLMQEWILFRCWQVTDYFRDLAGYARSLNPAIGVDSNGQCIRGVNHAFTHGVDHGAQAAYADAVWDENPDYRSEEHPAAIYPSTVKFRGANFLRRLDKEVLGGYKDEETLAANLTFTGHPGINHAWGYAEPGRRPLNPAQPGVAELLAHYRRHTALYTPVRSAARIGLWRSKLSLAFISTGTYLSACVLEQTLFNHRIPFSIISDGHVNGEKLKEFDLLILPDSQYVSQAQAAALIEFVKKGGSLLITENSGLYNDEGRRRTSPVFGPLFAGDWKAGSSRSSETWSFDPHQQFITLGEAGQPARALFGRGRAAYLPKLEYVYRPRTFKSRYNVHYDGIDSRYWKEPYNAAEVLETIQWLAPDSRPVTVYGNPELRLDYLAWPDGRLGAALLRCGPLAGTAEIALGVMSASKPAEGECLIPERKEPRPLTWVGRSDGYWETRLPEIGRHAVIRWRIVQKKKG
ncbi:MAG TPA: beta-galactosidase trimerization domain-containing protein, partial [bacterium]|nr:beta-galactosidase trimerization domain-containing protein [bacterium]